MKALTVTNLHGHHLGQGQPTDVVVSMRSYVELSVGGVCQRSSLSADESSYPMWHDKLNLDVLGDKEDGVLTVRGTA